MKEPTTMHPAGRALVTALAVIGAVALAAGLWLAARGVSARRPPASFEVTVARAARHLLVPASQRRLANPVRLDEDVLSRARAHFADHCAVCHGNDGRGDTPYGRNLSPRAPDLTAAATRDLSDGELFYLIENGVKLTGMPAFATGTPEGERESWELVHFIRHLPAITSAELAAMERLNPISRAQAEEEAAEEAFLRGAPPPARQESDKQP